MTSESIDDAIAAIERAVAELEQAIERVREIARGDEGVAGDR